MFNFDAMGTNLKLLCSILLLTVCLPIAVIAQTVGPNSPGTGNNVNVTGNSWSNPGKVTTSDNNWASVSLSTTQTSDGLVATNYGFSIPGTATIDGVSVSIERSGTITINFGQFTFIRDFIISLTKDGTNQIGDNKAIRTGLG